MGKGSERGWKGRKEGRMGGRTCEKMCEKMEEKICEGRREMVIYRVGNPRQNAEDAVKPEVRRRKRSHRMKTGRPG